MFQGYRSVSYAAGLFVVCLIGGCNSEAGGNKKNGDSQGDPIRNVQEKIAEVKNLLNEVMAVKKKSDLPAIEAKLDKLSANAGTALKAVPEMARPQYRKQLEAAMSGIQRDIEDARKRLRN